MTTAMATIPATISAGIPVPSPDWEDQPKPSILHVLGGGRAVAPSNLKGRACGRAVGAGREGTPSPFPVYLGRRRFLRPFVCEAAATRAPPGLPPCRRARCGGDACQSCASPVGPPPRHAQPDPCRLGPLWRGLNARGVAPQPSSCPGWLRTRDAHGMHTWDAQAGCTHGVQACTGCRCGVLAGGRCHPGPQGWASTGAVVWVWVPQCGCHVAELAGPAIVAAAAPRGL